MKIGKFSAGALVLKKCPLLPIVQALGVLCHEPTVRAGLRISGMKAGDVLEVIFF